jgi:hypothetical protein
MGGPRLLRIDRRCSLLPCPCRANLARWQRNLENEEFVWTLEDLKGIETSIFGSLLCAAFRCSDPTIRAYAQSQLANKHWDQQKEEEEQRRRRRMQ